jgi:hypothetical protein
LKIAFWDAARIVSRIGFNWILRVYGYVNCGVAYRNSDPSSWNQQELAPPGDLIATPQLEFEIGDLTPDTQYKIKITVILRDLHNSPTSKILSVRTPPERKDVTIVTVDLMVT